MNHPTLSNNKITTVEGATAVAAVIAGVLVVVLIVSAVGVEAAVVIIAVTKQQQPSAPPVSTPHSPRIGAEVARIGFGGGVHERSHSREERLRGRLGAEVLRVGLLQRHAVAVVISPLGWRDGLGRARERETVRLSPVDGGVSG